MISAALIAVSLAASGPAAIQVNEVALPAAAVTARAAELRERGVKFDAPTIVRSIVDETLLALDARRVGLGGKAEVRANVDAERTRALGAALLDREVAKEINPTEDLLRTLYHSNSDFVRLNLVVVGSEAEALAVRKRLDQGGEFALEATKSLDPVSSARRGDTGELARAQFPKAAADLLFGASVGSLVGPMQWGAGWGVAQVVARTIGDEAGFAAKRGAIETHARGQLTGQAKQHFLGVIRSREKIAVDEKFLDSLGVRVEPTAAEASHVLATVRGTPIRYSDALPAIRKLAGGVATAHRSGPTIKRQIVSRVVDDWILASLARERGLEKDPEVAALVLQAENRVLAGAAIDQILASLGPKATPQAQQKAVDDRLAALRGAAKISVDDAAVAAAIRAAK